MQAVFNSPSTQALIFGSMIPYGENLCKTGNQTFDDLVQKVFRVFSMSLLAYSVLSFDTPNFCKATLRKAILIAGALEGVTPFVNAIDKYTDGALEKGAKQLDLFINSRYKINRMYVSNHFSVVKTDYAEHMRHSAMAIGTINLTLRLITLIL